MKRHAIIPALLLALLSLAGCERITEGAGASILELQNVSYDPTREFYKEVNEAFAKHWEAEGKGKLTISQSHGGSGTHDGPARAQR